MILKHEIGLNYFDNPDAAKPLSYITDTFVGEWAGVSGHSAERDDIHYDNTLAIGITNSNGGQVSQQSYIYPHALFGTRMDGSNPIRYQIYPPIITTYLNHISGLDDYYKRFTLSNLNLYANISAADKTYLFPHLFRITYAYYDENNANILPNERSYQTAIVPSFDPVTESNNNQFAYYLGSTLHIKDPSLPNKIVPTVDSNAFSTEESNFDIHNFFTYFAIDYNMPSQEIEDKVKELYINDLPLCYVRQTVNGESVDIWRRQYNLGNQLSIGTRVNLIQNPTTYYIFRYYYNGTEITGPDNNAMLANLMPAVNFEYNDGSIGLTPDQNTNYTNLQGFDPKYIYFDNNITSGTNPYNVTITGIGGNASSPNYPNVWLMNTLSNKFSLFNLHLIKVTAAETRNMKTWGQKSTFLNWKSYNNTQTFNCDAFSSNITLNIIDSTNKANTYIFNPVTQNETHPIMFSDNPKKNSRLESITNTAQSQAGFVGHLAAVNMKHKFNGNVNLMNDIQTQFTYITASNISDYNLYDISSMSLTYTVANNTYTGHINVTLNPTTINMRTTATASSSLRGTYTYCYIAADMIGPKSRTPTTLIANRVISSTYLCIKCEKRTGDNTTTTITYFDYF